MRKLDRVVDRVKPSLMVHVFVDGLVHGLWYMVHGVFLNVLLEHGTMEQWILEGA